MQRRAFLQKLTVATGAISVSGSLWRQGVAAADGGPTAAYGPLQAPDANGLQLPASFTSRIVARSGMRVGTTGYVWHWIPDGGAAFPTAEGGWVYVCNSEIDKGRGGASAIRFRADGQIESAYRVLSGTNRNCSGGATPWGTWLSCEEVPKGIVWECAVDREAAQPRPAMGRFNHEAAAVDPVRQVIYLTEDQDDGCLYRFHPTTWPDLSTGTLEVATGDPASTSISWVVVPDPSGAKATRFQVKGARRFRGGEGAYYDRDQCFFTTKGDGRVWSYDATTSQVHVVYDAQQTGGPLTGVDNVTVSRDRQIFVAEDGGNMEICAVSRTGAVSPVVRVLGQDDSELTGVAFNPFGDRLYFSSQRGTSGGRGITYEVAGPF